MRARDATVLGHQLEGVYEFLLGLEREHVDPRLRSGKRPARPDRLARLEHGEPTLVPRWWLGGNYYPEAARWDNDLDRLNVRGWQISADDFVTPVGHDDPRWSEPGNRL